MVGSMTPLQKTATFKKYEARVQRLLEQLQWYQNYNHLFKRVEASDAFTKSNVATETQVVLDRTDGTAGGASPGNVVGLDEACRRFNAPAPPFADAAEPDETEEITTVALVTDYNVGSDSQRVQAFIERQNAIVRRSSSILSDFDPSFWVLVFVELNPFELPSAVFSSSRQAFDVLARHRSMQAVYLRAKMEPTVVGSRCDVDREELVAHLKRQEERLKLLSTNVIVRPCLQADQSIRNLYSFITTGMKASYGSNEERSQARSNLLYMQLQYGQPSIFFTLSPSSSSSVRVAAFAGDIDNSLLEAMTYTVQGSLYKTRAELSAAATSNPMACARYYNAIVHLLIDVLLNYAQDRQCSRPRSGGFGKTKAYFLSTESQNSTGDLDGHMLVWIENMPTTTAQYYELLKHRDFQHRVNDYVSSIASSSFPVSLDRCSSCSSTDIAAMQFSREVFKKPKRGARRAPTIK
ncbi:hypothetical protein L917_18739, partial [Phytophthora nicotianae]